MREIRKRSTYTVSPWRKSSGRSFSKLSLIQTRSFFMVPIKKSTMKYSIIQWRQLHSLGKYCLQVSVASSCILCSLILPKRSSAPPLKWKKKLIESQISLEWLLLILLKLKSNVHAWNLFLNSSQLPISGLKFDYSGNISHLEVKTNNLKWEQSFFLFFKIANFIFLWNL